MTKAISLACTSVFVLPAISFAQAVAPALPALPMAADPAAAAVAAAVAADPNLGAMMMLINSMGGAWGAGSLAVAGVVVKLLLRALDLPIVTAYMSKAFKDWHSSTKLMFVLGLSYASGVLALMVPPTSLPLSAAMVHSSVLAAFVVLSNQVYKHILVKTPAQPPAA